MMWAWVGGGRWAAAVALVALASFSRAQNGVNAAVRNMEHALDTFDSSSLYFATQGGSIGRITPNWRQMLFTCVPGVVDVAVDAAEGALFWANATGIFRVPLPDHCIDENEPQVLAVTQTEAEVACEAARAGGRSPPGSMQGERRVVALTAAAGLREGAAVARIALHPVLQRVYFTARGGAARHAVTEGRRVVDCFGGDASTDTRAACAAADGHGGEVAWVSYEGGPATVVSPPPAPADGDDDGEGVMPHGATPEGVAVLPWLHEANGWSPLVWSFDRPVEGAGDDTWDSGGGLVTSGLDGERPRQHAVYAHSGWAPQQVAVAHPSPETLVAAAGQVRGDGEASGAVPGSTSVAYTELRRFDDGETELAVQLVEDVAVDDWTSTKVVSGIFRDYSLTCAIDSARHALFYAAAEVDPTAPEPIELTRNQFSIHELRTRILVVHHDRPMGAPERLPGAGYGAGVSSIVYVPDAPDLPDCATPGGFEDATEDYNSPRGGRFDGSASSGAAARQPKAAQLLPVLVAAALLLLAPP